MWPIFGVVWPAGRELARQMVDFDVADKRILEVGCGIGLASLVLNHLHADITATDRHPQASAFLAHNVELNDGETIPFVRAGWSDEDEDELGHFDLIIGSDLLYEPGQTEALSGFIERHARPTCEVLIVDPRRGRAGAFRKMLQAQGFAYSERALTETENEEPAFRGRVLGFTR